MKCDNLSEEQFKCVRIIINIIIMYCLNIQDINGGAQKNNKGQGDLKEGFELG